MARTESAQADRARSQQPLGPRYLVPRDTPHYAELAAALTVAALLAHLLLAQLTLLLAVAMYVTGRVSRWRPQWLAAPAAVGLVWTLAIGPSQAAAGLADGPRQVIGYLGGIGGHPGHLLSPQDAFAGLAQWLPEQFPLALILAAAEIAVLTWLRRRFRGGPPWRPGLVVAARRWLTAVTLRSGGVVTRDGCSLGVDVESGRPAAISWSEAEGGVLCAGSDAGASAAQAHDGFVIAWAAIRRRKPVVIIDLTGSQALAESLATACLEARAPFSRFGQDGPGCYEPLRGGEPARAARLVCAMIDWSDVSDQQRRSCSAYLTDALAVQAAAPGDRRVPLLDDLTGLLTPDGLRARAALIPPYHPRRDVLADRAAVSASLLQADRAMAAAAAGQLAELQASALGHWLRPEPGEPGRVDPVRISLGLTVRERGVSLFSLDRAAHGSAARMIAGLAVADLIAVAAELEDMSVPADGLVWVNGCEGLGQQARTELIAPLIARGRAAGMAVVVSTTAAAAQNLAAGACVLVAHWPVDPALAGAFASAPGAGSGAAAGSGTNGSPAGEGTAPAVNGGAISGAAAPGSTVPGSTGSGSTVPGNTVPGNTGTAMNGGTASGVAATTSGLALTGAEFALMVGAPAAGAAQPRVLPHCRGVRARPGERAVTAAGQAGSGPE